MDPTVFARTGDLEERAFRLLAEHLTAAHAGPHAVMLTGGRTPRGLYGRVARSALRAAPSAHVLVSDERHVPLDSSESNYGMMRPMVASLGIDEARVMRVHTELPLEAAADRYHAELAAFIERGGRITLGLLGLGADGHVASLFEPADIARGQGRCAIAVPRTAGPDRISVTADLLARIEHLVFLVAGEDKAKIVARITQEPETVVAAQAVGRAARVEIWYAPGQTADRGSGSS